MKQWSVIAILVVIAGCSDVKYLDKPDPFYGDEKMAEMLTDLYLMESSMSTNRKAFTDLSTVPKEFIYTKYDTDSISFQQNFYYYSDRVKKYQNVMLLVEERMKVIKDSIAARQEREARQESEELIEVKPKVLLLDPDTIPDN